MTTDLIVETTIEATSPVIIPLTSKNVLDVKEKLDLFCKENSLDYIIAGGRFSDEDKDQENLVRLFFHSEILGEAAQDNYVLHQWLMKTGLDIVNYARRITDQLVHKYQLITIPADKIKPISDEQFAKIDTNEIIN